MFKKKELDENNTIQINDAEKFKEIIKSSIGTDKNTGNNEIDNSAKELELGKLVLAMIKNPEFLNSTTNLSLEEISDLSDAYYLNLIFDSDLIDEFVNRYQMLKRSETTSPRNMLTILSELAGKTAAVQLPESGFARIMGRIRGT